VFSVPWLSVTYFTFEQKRSYKRLFVPPSPAIGGERHYAFGSSLVRPSVVRLLTSITRDAIYPYLVEGF